MSLPAILKTTLSNIPKTIPYLFADPELCTYWNDALSSLSGRKVGIVWQGSPKYGGDKNRSIPLRFFASIARIDGVHLISLQKGFGTEQIQNLTPRFPIIDLDRQIDGENGTFMDTAAILKNLDLIITSDTAIAHLAGGLGVRTWVPLCCACDWRWMRDRTESPWYPTMRLFRQRRWGNWEDVFIEIADALRLDLSRNAGNAELSAPVSGGELLDKITILEIKMERITDQTKLANVDREYATLNRVRKQTITASTELDSLVTQLKKINESLWQIEDEIRDCDRDKDFGARFIELARSVYRENDRRARIKRQINELLGSRLIEEKSYADYE